MAYKKITDLSGKGVTGLADTPNLSAAELQRKFDELSKDIIIPSFNSLIDEIVKDGEPVKSTSVKAVKKSDSGEVMYTEDGLNWSDLSPSKADKSQVYTKAETEEKISERITEIGAADMNKSTYDSNHNGVVDDSEKLDGHAADYFANKSEFTEVKALAYAAAPKSGVNFSGVSKAVDTKRKISNHGELVNSYVRENSQNIGAETMFLMFIRK